VSAAHLPDGGGTHLQVAGHSSATTHTGEVVDPSFGWADVAWLRERTRLPLVMKGVLHPDDADRAVTAGADAIVVSNHGGRQLDGALPSVAALPAVLRVVDGRCPVYLDSGIRGGTDVLKALALGASGVLLGRPAFWGLAAGGEHGAATVFELVHTELRHAMVLAGCPDLARARELTVLREAA
jgi:4-hydroxymandelate oxidase